MTIIDSFTQSPAPVTTDDSNRPDDLDQLTAENARLVAERDQLLADRERAAADHQRFLRRLGRVAKCAAAEHGWCRVARDLVEDDLGAIWPTATFSFKVTKTWTVTGEALIDDTDLIDEAFIVSCLEADEDEGTPSLDSDWTNVSVAADGAWTVTECTSLDED